MPFRKSPARRETARPGSRRGRGIASLALLAGTLLALGRARADAPGTALPPASSGGLERLDPLLRKLATNRRLLIIAAHPDDEDSPLLTLVSRGMGGEAAYLSLSRGDGGQNLIGDELGPALGLLRTEELNAARRLDGARQFFTRAYDFGFSKSIDETFRLWPREALLEDTVRVIRRFRPQVLVVIFSGTSRDGHGQHQASGIVAREAFRLAGDPAAFPELAREGLFPWQPAALFQTTRFLDREKTTLVLPTGTLEPLTGRSFYQIGVASRSLQRSQGTGALQPIGPNEARVAWLEGGAGKEAKELFAGIDTRLAALAGSLPDAARRQEAETRLARAESLARESRQRVAAADLTAAVAPLASVLGELRAARLLFTSESGAAGAYSSAVLDEKISAAEAALACAAGIAVDALSDTETATPGESVPVTILISNAGAQAVEVESAALVSPAGWSVPAAAAGKAVAPSSLAEWKLAATVPAGALPTVPYFLEKPLQGALYDWSQAPAAVRGEPFAPPPLSAVLTVRISAAPVRLSREVTYRFRDEEFGEIRHPVRAVPKLELSVDPELIVWPAGRQSAHRVSVTVTSRAPGSVEARVQAALPSGWAAPARSVSLAKKGDRAVVDLVISPPSSPTRGRFDVPVEATLPSGEKFSQAIRLIDYEHIRPAPLPIGSALSLSVVDLKLPALKSVGYVRGASDRVPEALLAVGVPVHLLSPAELDHGDLSRFDAIVIGTRAYETEPALAKANARLLDYLRAGGLLIVQYQQVVFAESGFAPEKLEIVRPIDRVTDENAPVKILEPSHPIVTTPNRIGPADWEGWIQERGLYFAHSWAPAYVPLLSLADPGESEQRGALLAARIGKGHYVYTGLAFFRELPAGVPGAYRLFANMLAWQPSEKSIHKETRR